MGREIRATAKQSEASLIQESALTSLRTERRLRLQYAVTRALAESTTLEEAAPRILQAVCVFGSFELGELWLTGDSRDVFECAGLWTAPKLAGRGFNAAARGAEYIHGVGVAARVHASVKPLWISDLRTDEGLAHMPETALLGMHSVMAAPVRQGLKSIGALAFFFSERKGFDKDVLELVDVLGNQVGDFIRRREAEAKVVQSAHRFRALIENSSDAIALFDRDGRISYASPATFRILGYKSEELLTWHTFGQIHTDDRERLEGHTERILRLPEVPVRVEFRSRHKSGEWVWIEGIGTNMLSDPAVGRIVWNYRDVTARLKAEEEIRALNEHLEERVKIRTAQLQELNKELDAFSHSISHDLRSPLRAIDGFSRELLDRHARSLDEEGRRYLAIIREKTKSMGQLINDLLGYARVSSAELKKTDVDMKSLVDEVALELLDPLKDTTVRLAIRDLEHARGTRPLLRQVFVNLMSNAIKFSRTCPEPAVEVGCFGALGECVYYVKDNGIGFNVKRAERLFGLFQRQHSDSEIEGTGVGLAIVQRIIHRHGGRVWAESEKGKGAVFYFSIPKET